jgi:hypothetical protein
MTQATANDGFEIDRGTPFAACRNAREAAMAPRRSLALILWVLTSIAFPVLVNGAEPNEGPATARATESAIGTGAARGTDDPRVSGTLYPRTLEKLQEAFPAAVERVRENPECNNLFAQLGSDGLEKLATSLYYRSTPAMERNVCQRGSVAFTFINSPQVRLCKRFASLGTERAATVLIHEALHFAGMTEQPRDPDGPYPSDIDRMVKKACNF